MKKIDRVILTFGILLMVGAGSLTLLNTENSLEIIANPTYWLVAISLFFLFIAFIATFEALDAMKKLIIKKDGKEAVEIEEAEEEADWVDGLLHKLTDAVPVEDEEEIATDHIYDGIMELDNNLPPWWLAGFYLSIAFAVIYLLRFHVFETAPLAQEELKIELAEAELAQAEYLKTAANLVDENSVTFLEDDSRIAEGGRIFVRNCAVCHANDGGGGVGPNLADNYSIHGADIKSIFKTVKYGVPAKGMIPWKGQLNAGEIQEVSSYILTLVGTTPANPKEAQGELTKPSLEDSSPADSSAVPSATSIKDSTAISAF
jgi:cytochrome c oxidase cbb3-type subunit 3